MDNKIILQSKDLVDFMTEAYIMARKLKAHASDLPNNGTTKVLHLMAYDLFSAVEMYDSLMSPKTF